jgi:transcriptional regulator with XRE-family HTH domain
MSGQKSKTFRKEFAGRLRGLRLWGGYSTAREFAQTIGEEENTYTRWERGETLPSIEQLMTVCAALEVTPNQIMLPRPKKTLNAVLDSDSADSL